MEREITHKQGLGAEEKGEADSHSPMGVSHGIMT